MSWVSRTRSVLCVPVMNTKGIVIGVIQMLNKKRNGEVLPFSEQDQSLIKAFSSQTAGKKKKKKERNN